MCSMGERQRGAAMAPSPNKWCWKMLLAVWLMLLASPSMIPEDSDESRERTSSWGITFLSSLLPPLQTSGLEGFSAGWIPDVCEVFTFPDLCVGSGEGSLSQTHCSCLAAAVANCARSLGRERGCLRPWTFRCVVPMPSQALCAWGELTPLLRLPGMEKGQLACPGQFAREQQSGWAQESSLYLTPAQHFQCSWSCRQHQPGCPQSWRNATGLTCFFHVTRLPEGRDPLSLLVVETAEISLPGPSKASEGVSEFHLFSCRYQFQIHIIWLFLCHHPLSIHISWAASGSPFYCRHQETLLVELCQSLEGGNQSAHQSDEDLLLQHLLG